MPEAAGPVVRLHQVAKATLADPDDSELVWATEVDGQEVRLVRRHDDAHVIDYGAQARFVIGPERDEVVAAAADEASAAWQRFMLDTVLLVVSHLRGLDLLRGGAVDLGGSAVAILGGTGSGPSAIVPELVALGHPFVADGAIALERSWRQIVVHPGPPVMSVPSGTDLSRLGPASALASIGDDVWISVPSHADRPLALGAVVVVRRNEGGPPSLERTPATVVDLLGFSVGFEESRERDERRFHLVADVASNVPVFALDAPFETSPGGIAAMIEGAVLDGAGVARADP